MALIAHWPLNGNTNDISGNGYNLTSAGGNYTNGKIGQAYLSDLSTEYLYIPATNNSFQNIFNNNFSISFWYYANTGTENTNRGLLQYGVDASDTQLYLLLRASGNYFAIGFYSDDYNSNFVPTLGTWNHYTVIGDKNNGKQKLYINGQFYGERTATSWLNTPNSQLYLAYYSSYNSNGMMNDVRIYDHALTDMEVQEIARAKILHYTFDDMQEPTTNIISGDFDTTFESLTDGDTVGFYTQLTGSSYIGVSSDMGYYSSKSFKVTRDTGTRIYKTKAILAGDYITVSAMVYATSPGAYFRIEYNGGDYTWTVTHTKNTHTGGGWELLYASVPSSATSNTTLYYFFYPAVSGASVYLDNVQVEKKPYATEFTVGSRTGRVNDYSGFFNHSDLLTETTTSRWTADAKIGTGAYSFNGVNTSIQTASIPGVETFTASIWFKPHVTSAVNRIYCGTGSNRIVLTQSGSNMSWYIQTSTGSVGYVTTSLTYNVNSWNHAVLRYNGSIVEFFLNGVKDTVTGSVTGYSNAGSINLGTSHNKTDYFFDGELDDFRFYATPLLDSDITDLYEARAEIEESGVLYARDFLSNAEETTNLLSGQNITFTSLQVNISSQNLGDGKYRITSTDLRDSHVSGNFRMSMPTGILINGLTYNLSLKYRVISGTSIYFSASDWCDRPITKESISFPGYTLETAYGFRATYDNTFRFMDYTLSPNTVIEIWDVQLEQRSGWTPFVSTYRPATQLPSTLDFAGNEVHETGTANFEDFSTVGITDGLVGYWPMTDGTVRDLSGTGHGTTVNGTMYLDNSRYFDGVDDFINTNFNGRSVWTEPYTVMISVKIPSSYVWNTSYRKNIFGNGSHSGISGLSALGTENVLGFFLRHDSGSFAVYGPAIPRDQWIHMVGTWDGINQLKYYQNGVFINTLTVTSITGVPDNSGWVMGNNNAYSEASGGFMELYLKDAKYFNRALTAEEIAIEYNTMFNNQVQIHESGTVYARDIVQY